MNIVIFGPPLAGKGTLTKFLITDYGFDAVSTGALLRQEIEDQTDLGKKIKPILDAGGLIDVDDVLDIIENAFAQRTSTEGVIFDGSPRRVDEFEKLLDLLADEGETIDKVVVLDVPEQVLFTRMHKRRNDAIANGEKPRDDDHEDVLKDRLAEYHAQSFPVIAEAQNKNIDVLYIDGDQDIGLVQDELASALGLDDDDLNPVLTPI